MQEKKAMVSIILIPKSCFMFVRIYVAKLTYCDSFWVNSRALNLNIFLLMVIEIPNKVIFSKLLLKERVHIALATFKCLQQSQILTLLPYLGDLFLHEALFWLLDSIFPTSEQMPFTLSSISILIYCITTRIPHCPISISVKLLALLTRQAS